MEEIRHDGSRRETEGATLRDLERALGDKRNRRVILHMPGDVVEKWEKGQRRRYRVNEKGRLERITLDGRPWPTESGKP